MHKMQFVKYNKKFNSVNVTGSRITMESGRGHCYQPRAECSTGWRLVQVVLVEIDSSAKIEVPLQSIRWWSQYMS